MDVITRYATDPPHVVSTLIDAIAPRASAGHCVCELGFGPGWLLDEIRQRLPAARLYGLDLAPVFARSARDRYRAAVGIVLGDIEALPFAQASFDVIVTCWTLYFMRDIDAAIAGVKRCLRPGGRLIAATNAPDHMAEYTALAMEAYREATVSEPASDIDTRFDLVSGAAHMQRHFPRVELRTWEGELIVPDAESLTALWGMYTPQGLGEDAMADARVAFERLARQRIADEGPFRIRRRGGAFVCDT